MIIREVTLRGAGVEFRLTNRETARNLVESWLIDLKGFYGGVGVTDQGDARKLGHGNFPSPSLRTGRELTLSGVLVFTSESDRSLGDRFVSGLLWDGEYGELEVTTGDLTLTTQVKLAGEIQHKYLGTRALEVQIPLTAPDPFLYAAPRRYQIFPAGAGEGLAYPLFSTKMAGTPDPILDWGAGTPVGGAFANSGNADAHPVYTVHGSWSAGFRITTGSKVIEYPAPVVPGHPVTVDHTTGAVTVAGIDQTYRLTRRDWVTIPPGEAIQPRITALAPSNGWCDITVSDTYI